MGEVKHKPATALPWHLGVKQAEPIIYDATGWAVANALVYHGEWDKADTKANAAYIAHAANAYPKLVEALHRLASRMPNDTEGAYADGMRLLRELGEDS